MEDKEMATDINYGMYLQSPVSNKRFSIFFQPSNYLSSENDLWKLIVILGEKPFEIALAGNHSIINSTFIANAFKQSGRYFYLYEKGKKIFSSFNQRIESKYGKLSKIALYKVLDYLNVNSIEMLIEKGEVSY